MVDRAPSFTWTVENRSRLHVRPLASSLVMGVSPHKNLRNVQDWKGPRVSYISPFCQQQREGGDSAAAQRADPVYIEDRFNQLQQSITIKYPDQGIPVSCVAAGLTSGANNAFPAPENTKCSP